VTVTPEELNDEFGTEQSGGIRAQFFVAKKIKVKEWSPPAGTSNLRRMEHVLRFEIIDLSFEVFLRVSAKSWGPKLVNR